MTFAAAPNGRARLGLGRDRPWPEGLETNMTLPFPHTCSWLFALLVLCVSAPVMEAAEPLRVETLDGTAVDPLLLPADVTAAVYLFVSVGCPVSNRYAPEVKRLYDAFAAKGVRFTLVYPNPAESAAAIKDHLKAYGYPGEAVRDPRHAFAKQADVTITPEAAVFTRDGALAYRGRIDDRYVTLGVERPAPTRRDLAEALTDVLAGREVREPRTQAVGCYVEDFAR